MGICHSIACTVTTMDALGSRETFNLTLDELKTIRTIGDMLRFVRVDIGLSDTLFTQEKKEIRFDAPFQIQPIVVYRGKIFRYRIAMSRLY